MLTLTPLSPVWVPVQGGRAGSGPLTLGQLNILDWLQSVPEPFDSAIGGPFSVPAGVRVADVVEALTVLLARHEGLRTTFDPDAPPRQLVADSGEVAVEVYQVDPAVARDRPDDVAAELDRQWLPDLAWAPFQRPFWLALAVDREERVYVAAARLSHLVADFQVAAVVGRELVAMLADPAARVVGEPRHQPLDQAEREQSPRMRRRVDQAMRYWQAQLRRLPPCSYPAPRRPGTTGVGDSLAVEMSSVAAAHAVRPVAARVGVSRPSVVLAAVCAVLSHRTGTPELVYPTLANNRFEQHLAGFVGTLAQATIADIEVGGAGFDELVGRAALGVLRASRHGMNDVLRMRQMADLVGDERGLRFAMEPLFNSPMTEAPATEGQAAPPGPDQLRAELSRTTLRREPMRRTHTLLRFDLTGYDQVLGLRLWSGDTHRLPAGEAEQLLRAVERLLVAAAAGDVDEAGIREAIDLPPIEYGPEWLRIDSCWVELAEVRRLLDEALAPAPARILADPDGRQLVAYLVATEAVGTPEQAHARCLAALPGRPMAMAPRHYVLCRSVGDDPDDPAAWGPVVAEGSGRADASGGVVHTDHTPARAVRVASSQRPR